MNIVSHHTVQAILAPLAAGHKYVELEGGHRVKLTSSRLRLFLKKGVVCCRCGVEGNEFRLESHTVEPPHLNLYAVSEDGKAILMTKDHILPKSMGGLNTLNNYQTMCQPCNGSKGSKLSPEDEAYLASVAPAVL